MRIETIRLPITNALYAAPTNIVGRRDGDQVTISWDPVWMTQDDDNGYFLDVWVCQNGNYVWMPTKRDNQYMTTATFTDQPGCSTPSGGQNLYRREARLYQPRTDPVASMRLITTCLE